MPLPSPKEGESRDDFVSRCMDNSTMKEEFPGHNQRLAVCEQRFDSGSERQNATEMISVLATPDSDQIRRETFREVEHLVVPVVMLQEQVVRPSNSDVRELALVEEFGKHPQGWDGIPIVLNHPQRNGAPVSANSPDILEERAFGIVFNTTVEDDKLKAEMWVDPGRADELGESFRRAVDRLEGGEEVVEVSTGLFMSAEPRSGVHQGESFDLIWRGVVPDHLAVLPEGGEGACSVKDGCGAPRANADSCSSGESVQAVVLGSWQKGECKMGSQQGTSAGTGNGDNTDKGIFSTLLQKFGDVITLRSFRGNQVAGLSDVDTRKAIEAAMTDEGSDAFFIIAVFDGSFVYESIFEEGLYERNFEVQSDGTVVLGQDKTKVRPVTEFVPVETSMEGDQPTEGNQPTTTSSTSEESMDVDTVINSQANGFTEEDRDVLAAMSAEQLGKIPTEEPVGNTDGTSESGTDDTSTSTDQGQAHNSSQADQGGQDVQGGGTFQALSADQFIKQAPGEIQEVLQEGIRLQNQRREELVQGIKANSRNPYNEGELRDMTLAQLEKLASLAVEPSYAGAGAVRTQAATEDPSAPPEPPKVF